jgi:hypothetical protein
MSEQPLVDGDFVDAVSDLVGTRPHMWECVDPEELCRAVLQVAAKANPTLPKPDSREADAVSREIFRQSCGPYNATRDHQAIADAAIEASGLREKNERLRDALGRICGLRGFHVSKSVDISKAALNGE